MIENCTITIQKVQLNDYILKSVQEGVYDYFSLSIQCSYLIVNYRDQIYRTKSIDITQAFETNQILEIGCRMDDTQNNAITFQLFRILTNGEGEFIGETFFDLDNYQISQNVELVFDIKKNNETNGSLWLVLSFGAQSQYLQFNEKIIEQSDDSMSDIPSERPSKKESPRNPTTNFNSMDLQQQVIQSTQTVSHLTLTWFLPKQISEACNERSLQLVNSIDSKLINLVEKENQLPSQLQANLRLSRFGYRLLQPENTNYKEYRCCKIQSIKNCIQISICKKLLILIGFIVQLLCCFPQLIYKICYISFRMLIGQPRKKPAYRWQYEEKKCLCCFCILGTDKCEKFICCYFKGKSAVRACSCCYT